MTLLPKKHWINPDVSYQEYCNCITYKKIIYADKSKIYRSNRNSY